jgi:hypothetical protein
LAPFSRPALYIRNVRAKSCRGMTILAATTRPPNPGQESELMGGCRGAGVGTEASAPGAARKKLPYLTVPYRTLPKVAESEASGGGRREILKTTESTAWKWGFDPVFLTCIILYKPVRTCTVR